MASLVSLAGDDKYQSGYGSVTSIKINHNNGNEKIKKNIFDLTSSKSRETGPMFRDGKLVSYSVVGPPAIYTKIMKEEEKLEQRFLSHTKFTRSFIKRNNSLSSGSIIFHQSSSEDKEKDISAMSTSATRLETALRKLAEKMITQNKRDDISHDNKFSSFPCKISRS